jgi:hypothetical protein
VSDHLFEAQPYQSIGEPSPELAAEGKKATGWPHVTPVPQIDQLRSHDTSFWNDRANMQAIGATPDDTNYAADFYGDGDSDGIPSWQDGYGRPGSNPATAFYAEAGYQNQQGNIQPFVGYAEDGIISPDQVSPALPPGSPTVASQPAGNDAGGSPYP